MVLPDISVSKKLSRSKSALLKSSILFPKKSIKSKKVSPLAAKSVSEFTFIITPILLFSKKPTAPSFASLEDFLDAFAKPFFLK